MPDQVSIAFVLLRSIKRNFHSQSTITQAWRERAKQRGFIERPAPSQSLQQAEASPIRWSSPALRYRNQRYPVWTDTRHGPRSGAGEATAQRKWIRGLYPPPPHWPVIVDLHRPTGTLCPLGSWEGGVATGSRELQHNGTEKRALAA